MGHIKFILRRNRGHREEKVRCKAVLVVFEKRKINVIKTGFHLLQAKEQQKNPFCTTVRESWKKRHFNFRSTFSGDKLERVVYATILMHLCNELE